MINRNKKIIMILSTVFTVVLAISFTYAFFYYGKEGSTITLEAGSIVINFEEETNYFTIHDTYPKSDTMGMIDVNYYDFTVSGSKGAEDDILYEIQVEQLEGNTIQEEYVSVYLTDQDDNELGYRPKKLTDLSISKYNGNRVVYDNYICTENQVEDYRLRIWVNEDYTENVQNTFNFKVVLYAVNDDANTLYETVEETLSSYLLEKDGEEDYDARIVSGSKDDENLKNYVWYSGKLWRIVALNNNGTIKIVTDNNITTIAWGETSMYEDSYMYEWLNTVFLDTLYNYKNMIVTDYLWNATQMADSTIKPPKTTMISNPVGALNVYEYVRSYSKTGIGNSYLNKEYYWLTLTPYNGSNVWHIMVTGHMDSSTSTTAYGVRPSVVLKPNVVIQSGNGSKGSPYILKDNYETAKNNDLLNERMSGEYIKFNNAIYRIIGVERINNQLLTKVTMMDYDINNNTLSQSETFGNRVFSETQGIGLYLKNWYGNLDVNEQQMIATKDEGIVWRQGPSTGTGNDYKNSFQGDKISSTIGLPHYGELFATQQGDGSSVSNYTWLMTRYDAWGVMHIYNHSFAYNNSPANSSGVRPSFYLKSNVKIKDTNTDGDIGDGTINNPYEIAM